MRTKQNLLRRMIQEEVQRQIREADAEAESQVDSSSVVDTAINKIQKSPVMTTLLKIKSDTHKAQLIMRFAELIGVPKNKLQMVVSTLRQTAQ